MDQQQENSYLIIWRGRKLVVGMNRNATLRELGEKLKELTNVGDDTLRLLVPMESSSKVLYPFSDLHSSLRLDSTLVTKGKSIRMMGVPKDEVDELLKTVKVDQRIAGFDEEEKRLKQRNVNKSYYTLPKLPQGNYVFCDFQTLSLPGIELNPPASKALELLHKIASDPGIVAIMNKHRWRVGILTEMAPVGYVGISPMCLLGLNKNHGEEISLRLRTDDLKGFRKYESIKKTLLHELAHMVFSEHDSNFYALDSQLNKEAATLDWTKSRGHTLSGGKNSQHHYEEDFDISSNNITLSQKLGGQGHVPFNPRSASANAAFERLANTSFTTVSRPSEENTTMSYPGDHEGERSMVSEPYAEESRDSLKEQNILGEIVKPDADHSGEDSMSTAQLMQEYTTITYPGDREDEKEMVFEPYADKSGDCLIEPNIHGEIMEPGLADRSGEDPMSTGGPDQIEPLTSTSLESGSTHLNGDASLEPHAEDMQTTEPDPDEYELQIIQDPVTLVFGRLERAIQSLKYEVMPPETERVLQMLIRIICNVIEHPNDMKFKKLRKANPMIQRNIVTCKAAMDILTLVGFCENVITDEWGKAEVYLMLKRNDPGLLWLAKSSLETYIA